MVRYTCITSGSVTEGAGTMLISVIPPTVKEFTGYTIRCQYPPPGVNASTTGVLQVTHQSPPSDDVIIYSHDFDANSDTFNSAIQVRKSLTPPSSNLIQIEWVDM